MRHNLIILEGMSTSGKTTVMKLLSDTLNASGYHSRGFDELLTMDREIFSHLDTKKSLEEIRKFMEKECTSRDAIVICDRFHLSHLAITNGSVEDLKEIEAAMKLHRPLLVFLEIPADRIQERLLSAKTHRGQQWSDELKIRGQTDTESLEWFAGTQNKLFNLYQQSSLSKVQFDTSKIKFQEIASELANMIV